MSPPLIVPRHRQDDSKSCGRACAQSVIGFEFARLGVASGTPLPDQSVMAAAEPGQLPDWETEPFELAAHINSGLQALPNSKRWAVVEFKPTAVSTIAPNVEVASGLLGLVKQKKDAGFPSVVMIDGNDHWETVIDYEVAADHTKLFTIDPLPPLGQATVHSDADTCAAFGNTVWFSENDSDDASALVCDTAPFIGSAIGIVPTDPSDLGVPPPAPDLSVLNAWEARRELDKFNFRDPLPPLDKNLPLIALMNFFKRDMWRILGALERLPEAASYSDFDWSRVVVRQGSFVKDPARRMAIVAAPPVKGKGRSILLSLARRGGVDAMHLTSSQRVVETLGSAGDEPLWIVPKYSRWLPFVRIGQDPPARYRRLYDGFEIQIPPERQRKL